MNELQKNREDTDQLMMCSSELAKQRGGACSFMSLGERGDKRNKEIEHSKMARK